MMQRGRPEKGGCDALSFAYGQPQPCSRYAKYTVDGHELCKRHAQTVALNLCVKNGLAIKKPVFPIPTEGIAFISDLPKKEALDE